MSGIQGYRITDDRHLVVVTPDGRERPATEREWLDIWLLDPRVTLALAD